MSVVGLLAEDAAPPLTAAAFCSGAPPCASRPMPWPLAHGAPVPRFSTRDDPLLAALVAACAPGAPAARAARAALEGGWLVAAYSAASPARQPRCSGAAARWLFELLQRSPPPLARAAGTALLVALSGPSSARRNPLARPFPVASPPATSAAPAPPDWVPSAAHFLEALTALGYAPLAGTADDADDLPPGFAPPPGSQAALAAEAAAVAAAAEAAGAPPPALPHCLPLLLCLLPPAMAARSGDDAGDPDDVAALLVALARIGRDPRGATVAGPACDALAALAAAPTPHAWPRVLAAAAAGVAAMGPSRAAASAAIARIPGGRGRARALRAASALATLRAMAAALRAGTAAAAASRPPLPAPSKDPSELSVRFCDATRLLDVRLTRHCRYDQPLLCAHECVRIFRAAHLRPTAERPGSVDYHALATAAQLAHSAVTAASPATADASAHGAEEHAVRRVVGRGLAGEAGAAVVTGLGDDVENDEDGETEEAGRRAELVVKWRAALQAFNKALPSSAAAAQSGAVGASLAGARLAAALETHPAAAAEHRRAWEARGGALLADVAEDDDDADALMLA